MGKLKTLKPTIKPLEGTGPRPGGWGNRAGTSTERGYGWAWQKLRAQILARDCYRCQECMRQGRITAAREVDHIVNKLQGGTDEPSNLQSLCVDCHKLKTQRESRGG